MINGVPGDLSKIKAGYRAATQTRFSTTRTGLGGTGDAHIAGGLEYGRVREICRDMVRNDMLIGQMLERATDNIARDAAPIPATGDPLIDAEIMKAWADWSKDPAVCDVAAMNNFNDMLWAVTHHLLMDGDVFAMPIVDSGIAKIQLIEGDWITSPTGGVRGDGIIHGVEINDLGKPQRYWLSPPSLAQYETQGIRTSGYGKHEPKEAFDSDGNPLVFHVRPKPKRISMHRGMPALTPVVELAGQVDDLNFAKILQQQLSACIGIFIERTMGEPGDTLLGERTTEQYGTSTRVLEKLSPGAVVKGGEGEKLHMIGGSAATTEFMAHLRMLLRMIGANIGMPLCLALLDASETNFHGYRGEITEAREGFKKLQQRIRDHFCAPAYRFFVRWLAFKRGWNLPDEDLIRHRWSFVGWSYIKPFEDAQADAYQIENLLISPRDALAERGLSWEDTVRETVEDQGSAIRQAIAMAQAISQETGETITWRDVLNRKTPAGTTFNTTKSTSEVIQQEGQQ